ncbi:MAG: SGNH/GDSL hydrolase family protein [Elusimicrobia bacterium]|nr:SGNH/GDSL hydrolase family protein [Elusimicrobiota bacterium]
MSKAGPSEALRLRHKLGLALAAVLLPLAVLEGLGRLFPVAQVTMVRPSPIPNVGYQLVNDWDVGVQEQRFRINHWGFKGPDFPREKAPGSFRIALLGDSLIYGAFSAPNDPAPTLQRLLAERPPKGLAAKVEVINASVPSFSTCQELAFLKGYVDDFEPDLVVVGYAINDPEGIRSPFGLDASRGEVTWGHRIYHWLKRHSVTLRWVVLQVSPFITRLRGHAAYGPADVSMSDFVTYMTALHDPKGEFWPRCAECIAGFGRYQKEKGVPVVFLVLPELDRLSLPEFKALYAQVASTARRHGMLAMDMRAVFAAQKDMKPLRGDGVHPSPAGYLLEFEAVHKFLIGHPALFAGRGRGR